MRSTGQFGRLSRRGFLTTSAAASLAVSFPNTFAYSAAKHTRKSLQGPNVAKDLATYKTAVKAMLELPPTDPRNWYRYAFTHLMDCPHGNWWFLVWHRGYLGWIEQICRELTGVNDFALPFWDWTKEPAVPAAFWDDVLDPNNSAFVPDVATFRDQFRPALEAYWDGLSPGQRAQQTVRRYPNFQALWNDAESVFFPQGQTRRPTQRNPELVFADLAVKEPVIKDLLAPERYVETDGSHAFETAVTTSHHGFAGDYAILEDQPHNLVHGDLSGFMGDFLSPVDPIFFMHHCNIDRLWDVWTRKQQVKGQPTGPDGSQVTVFAAEPFLFFHDRAGNPTSLVSAGDYFNVESFGYDYEPGTGEDVIQVPLATGDTPSATTSNTAVAFGIETAARSAVALPTGLAERMAADEDRRFFATVTITPPDQTSDVVFDIFVSPKGQEIKPDVRSANFAGSVSFFGELHHKDMTSSFTVGITDTVRRLRQQNALTSGQELDVVLAARSTAGGSALESRNIGTGKLNAVSIGAF